MTVGWPGPLAGNKAQIITSPPLCLTVVMMSFVKTEHSISVQTWCCVLWPNISTVVLYVQGTLIQKTLQP